MNGGMDDVVFLSLFVAAMALASGYVRACGWIVGRDDSLTATERGE